MKKHLLQSLLAVALLLVCGNVWGETKTVTYTFGGSSKEGWSVLTSGTAPFGSAATYTQTYGTLAQITKGNSETLTLTGFAGVKITGITMSMHSNSSSGTGQFSLKAGSVTLAEIASNTGFNQPAWNGGWTQDYVDVTPTMANSGYVIKTGELVVFSISASANSLYCRSITLTYESTLSEKELTSIAVSGTPTKKEYNVGDTFDPAGLVVTGTYDDGTTDDVTSECTFSCTPATLTLGTTSVAVKVTCNSIESAIVNINISVSAATEYCLVTDANNLRSGDVIVLGCAGKEKAAGVFDDKYLTSVDATIANGVLTSKDAIEITLGGIAGAWTLTTSEGQITASEAKALKLNDGTQKTCSISIDENNNASITYGSYGSIQYNSSSPRFLNYTSTQTAIQIYKKVINTQDIAISSVGWATASVPFTATVSGATAYTAKVKNGALVMTPITVIPAGAGVLLVSVNGGATTATFTESGLEGEDVTDNQLRGNATNASVTWGNEEGATAIFTYYIFANDAEDGLGFYWQKGTGGSSVSCGAYKAALVVPGAPTTEPAVIGYRLDGTTMVEQMLNDSKGAEIYDILGRKVENATKGLYIIGGKKVMVK